MGREVKRVPLDFDAPMAAWAGYHRPEGLSKPCTVCEGRGQSPLANMLQQRWYGQGGQNYSETGDAAGAHRWTADCPEVRDFALKNVVFSPSYYLYGRLVEPGKDTPLEESDLERPEVERAIQREGARLSALWNKAWYARLSDLDLESILASDSGRGLPANLLGEFDRDAKVWVPFDPQPTFTARQVSAMNIHSMQIGMGACMDRVIREMGGSWDCPNENCSDGITFDTAEQKAEYEAWESTEPPEGEGYQMWQTVSDGPITPVFATPEALARHCANMRGRVDEGTSYETWLRFIKGPGWAPSAMQRNDGPVMSGVEMLSGEGRLEDIFSDVDQ